MPEKESLLVDNEYIIMSEVAENEKVTQRELSKKLGVSVSTINILMNKMIREGLIKMTQVSQKQVLYMLTPVGMMEKAKKTVSYLKAHYRAIFDTKEKIKSVLDEMNQENDVIYVLVHDDEMSEILTIAVHEYQSKHSIQRQTTSRSSYVTQRQTANRTSYVESNIKIIYSMVDIDVESYDLPILIHMTMNEDIINKDVMNEYKNIMNLEIVNLVDRL